VSRPALEVADIFRDHGAAWRHANAGHVSLDQLKVMSAIERCRTAALGGHVGAPHEIADALPRIIFSAGETAISWGPRARCENDNCGYTQIAYNSCLMGKSSNGELAAT